MQFRFGSEVRERDDSRLGELTRAVYNPQTEQVASLVVQPSAIEQGEVLVPIGAVRSADDEAVSLEIDHDQFLDDLDSFEDIRNLAPPPETEEPEEPGLPGVPPEPPIGAATGIESIAYTPIIQEDIHVPRDDVVLDSNTEVWASDGELGRLREVDVNDETHRVTTLVVAHGFVFVEHTPIPIDLVSVINSEHVLLNVPKRAVAGEQK